MQCEVHTNTPHTKGSKDISQWFLKFSILEWVTLWPLHVGYLCVVCAVLQYGDVLEFWFWGLKHNITVLSFYLLRPRLLWLSSLIPANPQQNDRCRFLLGMYAVHETSALTHMFWRHCTLVHWLLYYWYYALNSHPVLSISQLSGYLTSQCSWECRKTPWTLWTVLHG